MSDILAFHESRSVIAAGKLSSIYREISHEGIKKIICEALGFPTGSPVWNIDVHEPGIQARDSISGLLGAIAELEEDPYPLCPVPETALVFESIIHPLSRILKEETGTPLCARDIAEQVPRQTPLPQWCVDRGWDITDARPARYAPLTRRDVRLSAYPIVRGILQENGEWITAEFFLQKCVQDDNGPPRRTILREIFYDAYWRNGTGIFENESMSVLLAYLDPNLWPSSQRQAMLAVRDSIVKIKGEVVLYSEQKPAALPLDPIFHPEEGRDLIQLISRFLNDTEQNVRPRHLRLVRSPDHQL